MKTWMILGALFVVAVLVYYFFFMTKAVDAKVSAQIYFFPGGALPTQDAGNLLLDDEKIGIIGGGSSDPRDGGWIQ